MNQQPSEQSRLRRFSSQPNDCAMVDDSIEEYALGILEPARKLAVERHLVRCASCSTLVVSFRQTAAVLALAVPLAQPPVTARTALMARIAVTSQTETVPRSVYAGSLEALRTPSLPTSQADTPPEASQQWWRVYAAPLATLPLLLALGLVAAWGMNSYAQLGDRQNEIAARDLQIDRLSLALASDNSQGVAEVASSPSSKRYTLTPEDTSSTDDAQGTLIADPQSENAVLRVTGLSSGTYAIVMELQDGTTVSKGELDVDSTGSATRLLILGGQVNELQSVHIRPTTSTTESDVVALADQPDVLMTLIGPDVFQNSGTSSQAP